MRLKRKKFNEGIIPTSLGAVVTGIGATMLRSKKNRPIAYGVAGFGLAHILLGGIDIFQHKK
jgi:hypothetical protein